MFDWILSRMARSAAAMVPPHPAWLGMDRQMRKLMTLIQWVSNPDVQSPKSLRRSYRLSSNLWNIPADPTVMVRDESLNDDISLRWYTVADSDNDQCLVYYHGGGMMIGDLDTHDRFCRRIARKRRMTVVAVDYRLAPEHPFPAGAEDAIVAWNAIAEKWQSQGGDLRQLGIGGDSAGGYLAAVVCQQHVRSTLSVKPEHMPAWQWLIYPMLNCLDRSSSSWVTYSHDLILTSQLVARFHDTYVPNKEEQSLIAASPACADAELLAALPPAVVITAEYDPLRDQGVAYARALKGAEVAVAVHHESKLPHGYINFTGFSDAALRATEKAISLIDMICLQARRTLPVKTQYKTEKIERT
ncbi:alpha/beta hydrolase [Parendozoicomonas haliclonae]|uniref:Carboxylesterase NlhH n=1 Tax=Parendozoicomonas haliclonae TaxID=1960125 RepID=A0A1X7AQG3_9GAMM|nr:alpha/beta hydrolase [Parendozoicomonas haliclonae]SMA50485.1 Carboxylesterase NlhH [Parendozoicomonas haliclonae]